MSGPTKTELLNWLAERHQNCLRIGATKFGSDRDGWREDAMYFEAAFKTIKELAPDPPSKGVGRRSGTIVTWT
jgi:hypothetical protein